MKKIIVTGGTGFIGSHVIKDLAGKGHKLFVISRKRIKFSHPNVRYLKADLLRPASLKLVKKKVGKCDILVDMAALIPDNHSKNGESKKILANLAINTSAHVSLINIFRDSVQKIVFLSTVDVYGDHGEKPYTENSLTLPDSYYSVSKLAAEHFLRIFCDNNSIKLIILRLSQVYGPGDRMIKAIPIFIDSAINGNPITLFGKGEDKRRYIYVDDMVRAIRIAIKKEKTGIFNIAGKEVVTLKQIIDFIGKNLGKKLIIIKKERKKGLQNKIMNIGKAKKELGFRPEVSIENGLRMTIESERR